MLATGVLSIPFALYTLGAVTGAIFIAFWGGLNTCEFQTSTLTYSLADCYL
jgi:hypothetical protein